MSDIEVTDPEARICAWSGRPFDGKYYVLPTSEGQEIVSEAAFRAQTRAVGTLLQQIGNLGQLVHALESRVAALETAGADPGPEPAEADAGDVTADVVAAPKSRSRAAKG